MLTRQIREAVLTRGQYHATGLAVSNLWQQLEEKGLNGRQEGIMRREIKEIKAPESERATAKHGARDEVAKAIGFGSGHNLDKLKPIGQLAEASNEATMNALPQISGEILPATLTTGDILTQIFAVQQYLRIPPDKQGKRYSATGYFRNTPPGKGLLYENRRVAFRIHDYGKCVACGVTVPKSSIGDHLIPTAKGGHNGADNYVPLCGRAGNNCNSSKGTKDFFEWFYARGYSLKSLPVETAADLLCIYARLSYQALSPEQRMFPASPMLVNLRDRIAGFLERVDRPALFKLTDPNYPQNQEVNL